MYETNAGLVVIDPLHAATTGRTLYDGANARNALQDLKSLCTRLNVAVLILHDLRERGYSRPAESQQLSAVASMFMALKWRQDLSFPEDHPEPFQEDDEPASITYPSYVSDSSDSGQAPPRIYELAYRGRGFFANGQKFFASPSPLEYEPVDPPGEALARIDSARRPVEEAVIKAIQKEGMMCVSEIIGCTDMAPSTVKNAVSRLFNCGILDVGKIESGVRKYRISRK